MKGKVVFVGAGPGAPDLITVRGARVLAEAVHELGASERRGYWAAVSASACVEMDCWRTCVHGEYHVRVALRSEETSGQKPLQLHDGGSTL